MFEEIRECANCAKPFRAYSKAARFCGPDCRAEWHDRHMVENRQGLPVVIDDDPDEDPDAAIVLELEDAPRRKRLYDFMVRWGHPVWHDEQMPPETPSAPLRPKYAEQIKMTYPDGIGGPAVKLPWRHGR
jgi:hypothetical protein